MLLDALRQLSDENTLVSFDELARLLLADPESQIRARAIRLLDESHDPKLVPPFIKILTADADAETRAEAATALGRYVELGELEEIPAPLYHQVEDTLLRTANGEDADRCPPQCPRVAGLLWSAGGPDADRVSLPPRESGLAGQRPLRHGPFLG